MSGEVALQLENVTKIYPGTVALENVDLEVLFGEVHGLIGKNGAGKSTLVSILAGLISPTSGHMRVCNEVFSHFRRAEAKEKGISIVTQEPETILDITVAENLFLGNFAAKKGMIDWRHLFQKAADILARYGLNINVELMAGDLSLSERQLLLIITACVVDDSKIIILDESSAALTQKDALILKKIVGDLKSANKAIIYISHHIEELLEICDRLTVLRDGRSIVTKDKQELNHESLSALIVGNGFTLSKTRTDETARIDGEELISLSRLTSWGHYNDISFTLHKGEIIGIAGLRGSGRTELLKGIAGIEPADCGEIYIKGRQHYFKKPCEALANGVAYLPEERELEGIIKLFSIKDNLVLNSLCKFSKCGFVSNGACEVKAQSVYNEVQMKAFSIEQIVEELSGGNKQKVVIGRIMSFEPLIYLLDEPTRGVDIGAKKSILSIIAEKIRGSAGVIITSPGLDDLIDICDRIFVLYKGRIVKTYVRPNFDEKQIFIDVQGHNAELVRDNKCLTI